MFVLDSKTKSKLGLVATLLAPMIVVQGVRTFLGPGTSPAAASAAASPYADPAAPTSTIADRPLTESQLKALAWNAARELSLPLRSPMLEREIIPEPSPVRDVPAVPVQREAQATPQTDASPSFTLTGMIAGENHSGSLTTINHRVYRVGDQIIKGWTITEIDTRKRLVRIVGPEQQNIEIPMPPLAPQ